MLPRILWILRWCAICTGLTVYYAGIFWHTYEPLKKYGVTYVIDSGEHEESQDLQFYWERNQRRFEGPRVFGDNLFVTYKHVDHEDVPELVVGSRGHPSDFAVFKLNFTDSSKPPFELVGREMMGVRYAPPWENYYKSDPDGQLIPSRADEGH